MDCSLRNLHFPRLQNLFTGCLDYLRFFDEHTQLRQIYLNIDNNMPGSVLQQLTKNLTNLVEISLEEFYRLHDHYLLTSADIVAFLDSRTSVNILRIVNFPDQIKNELI